MEKEAIRFIKEDARYYLMDIKCLKKCETTIEIEN
jgi:hypothetical protein